MTALMKKPRLIVLDVDSTLIENEVIELLAKFAGSLDLVAEITERAMQGELDFSASLRERVATLKGLPESIFMEVRKEIVVTPGVPKLIEAIHKAGGWVGVVSGGFHEVLDPLARELNLDFWKANRLEIKEGKLTGKVSSDIVDAKAKAKALIDWANEKSVPLSDTVAIGDGANDLEMMAVAGLSIGFNAKPIVREKADVCLDQRDMSLVLDYLN
jgi:phosphoserine phosphatase